MCQREAGPDTQEGGDIQSCCPARGRIRGKHSVLFLSIAPSSSPSQHFPTLGLSLLCVWVVIMAGCPSRKVWPRFTQWGGGEQRVGWWGYHSPSPTGPILPNQNHSPHRRGSAGSSNSKGAVYPASSACTTAGEKKDHWDIANLCQAKHH